MALALPNMALLPSSRIHPTHTNRRIIQSSLTTRNANTRTVVSRFIHLFLSLSLPNDAAFSPRLLGLMLHATHSFNREKQNELSYMKWLNGVWALYVNWVVREDQTLRQVIAPSATDQDQDIMARIDPCL